METSDQCAFCMGTGKCAKCKGTCKDPDDPSSLCSWCDGVGQCPECNGSGRRVGAIRELWRWYDSLDYYQSRFVTAGALLFVGMTVVAWRIMVPLLVFIGAVIMYLHSTRAKDSL